MMRRFFLALVVIALLVSTGIAYAAPPENGPPGVARAIAAQEEHNPVLLTIPGVVGTAVGMGGNGTAIIRIFTERPGVGHIPLLLNGVPVVTQVTGKLTALKAGAARAPGKSTAPLVTIEEPASDVPPFDQGDSIHFRAWATDQKGNTLSGLTWTWTSSLNGPIGSESDFYYSLLSPGTHVITASATDSRRRTGTATVGIAVVGSTPDEPATTDRWPRPVPIGVSTGNYEDPSAGTIACRVKDEFGNVYALSNAHVYAPNHIIDGDNELEDIVTQPGLYDVAGKVYYPNLGLELGRVFDYKPINGSVFVLNTIDAAIATARTDTGTLTLDNATPSDGYGVPKKVTTPAQLNMAVQKFGRTTRLTKGTITGINATFIIGYGPDWYAWFTGQIVVEPSNSNPFIQPGDSGSLLVTDPNANPVGLLFAGNADGTTAIANPIDAVLQYFGVTIDGN